MKFEKAVEFIIGLEAGYVENSSDPGGATNFGISQRAYPNLDIKNLTKEEAADIYRRDYWDALRIDQMPEPIQLMVFDAGINQGKKAAVLMLQGALGVPQDGALGALTFTALRETAIGQTFSNMVILRHNRYADNANWPSFGKGWSKRLLQVTLESVEII